MRPEDFPLGSLESRAAARAVLEAKKAEASPLDGLAEIIHQGREQAAQRLLEGLPLRPKLSAHEWTEKAESLAKTARLGDKFAADLIDTYKRMARAAQEDEDRAKAPERKSDASPDHRPIEEAKAMREARERAG